MATVMASIDKYMGSLAPNVRAAKTGGVAKHIVVFAAAGDQGRSVCESLIKDGMFLVTAITIFAHGEIADSLRHKGVQVVKGDISDPSTYEQYLEGKDGAFVNADFMDVFHNLTPNSSAVIATEIKQSITAIDMCQKAGIKHIVYSGLDEMPPGVEVPHCASKAEVVKHIRSNNIPATILYPSHPFSDILHWGFLGHHKAANDEANADLLQPTAHHNFLLSIPAPDECVIPGYAVEQIGDWVKVAFKNPDKWIGRDMQACGERISVGKMAEDLSQIINKSHHLHGKDKKHVETLHLSKEEFYSDSHRAKLGEPLWAQYRACLEHHFTRDEVKSAQVAPQQWSFKQWAKQHSVMQRMLME